MSDRHWLAGLFEGEGSFSIRKDRNSKRMVVQIKSTDEDVIDSVLRIAGIGFKNGPYAYKNPAWKPYWQWSVSKRQHCVYMAMMLGPLLHRRRLEQMEATLHEMNEHSLDMDILDWKRKLLKAVMEEE